MVLKQNVDSKCRICHQCEEHISHIISGCSTLAPTEYTERHNNVAKYIHWAILKQHQVPVSNNWYDHSPEAAVETDEAKCTTKESLPTVRFPPTDLILFTKKHRTHGELRYLYQTTTTSAPKKRKRPENTKTSKSKYRACGRQRQERYPDQRSFGDCHEAVKNNIKETPRRGGQHKAKESTEEQPTGGGKPGRRKTGERRQRPGKQPGREEERQKEKKKQKKKEKEKERREEEEEKREKRTRRTEKKKETNNKKRRRRGEGEGEGEEDRTKKKHKKKKKRRRGRRRRQE
ncbi:unnamed protein product [Acanthoscelides obtectus]|uniref:Uncharacterized protein n=1 Tax=Acanthoscelides obtectus TaxID=200917 RepID=A0A9P0QET2_ACAOB|nr:unnamed protein product [Acanthoscelides obtectus]CAK1682688.1 hypothetical protein AOBTE_LOCUS33794 [Acanthoscelides obtectus]